MFERGHLIAKTLKFFGILKSLKKFIIEKGQ